MRLTINLAEKIQRAGALGKGVGKSGQALAFAMPYMICEDRKDFQVLTVDNINILEHIPTGKRYKVCCSQSPRFDISPSFTKGAGRDKSGILSYIYYVEKVAQGVAFCRIVDRKVVEVIFKDTKNIVHNEDGIVNLLAEYVG